MHGHQEAPDAELPAQQSQLLVPRVVDPRGVPSLVIVEFRHPDALEHRVHDLHARVGHLRPQSSYLHHAIGYRLDRGDEEHEYRDARGHARSHDDDEHNRDQEHAQRGAPQQMSLRGDLVELLGVRR